MQHSFNFYSRAIFLGESHFMKHACNSSGSWFSLLDKIIEKYQVSTEHHTFGSPTDSVPILNNMMNIYESLWYQNITRSADNKLRTYSSIKTKFFLEPYIIHTGTSKRRNITRLRISCHPLAVETGRYNKPKTPIGQRLCEHCDLGQIENEHHMIFVFPFYTDERKSLFENLSESHP